MKPTRQSTNNYVKVQFKDIGELTKYENEMLEDIYPTKLKYARMMEKEKHTLPTPCFTILDDDGYPVEDEHEV